MDSRLAVDDGYRNTTEFLRARLRISAPEARRRLALAGASCRGRDSPANPCLPSTEELGAAVAAGEVASRAATIITLALDRVRHTCDAEAAARMEHALTRTAAENDQDFLARVARSWTDALDQDGAEPTEELLRQLQGAFIRKPRHGLQHLEIFATAEQFEYLLTVMNTATNPRTSHTATQRHPETAAAPERREARQLRVAVPPARRKMTSTPRAWTSARGRRNASTASSAPARSPSPPAPCPPPEDCARRSWSPSTTATSSPASNTSPATPTGPGNSPDDTTASQATASPFQPGAPMGHTGTMLFTGPVTAATARKIACDADIIPVLLGGEGRILDIGRASRVFPPHIRKALTARDQGCAFPGCTIPAPWCEAHHITYWSRGGPTGTENGTLLCSHHHHVIHKEQWTIQIRTGIPWFIPPPHIDPRQKPRRNYYFHPADLTTAA